MQLTAAQVVEVTIIWTTNVRNEQREILQSVLTAFENLESLADGLVQRYVIANHLLRCSTLMDRLLLMSIS